MHMSPLLSLGRGEDRVWDGRPGVGLGSGIIQVNTATALCGIAPAVSGLQHTVQTCYA